MIKIQKNTLKHSFKPAGVHFDLRECGGGQYEICFIWKVCGAPYDISSLSKAAKNHMVHLYNSDIQ